MASESCAHDALSGPDEWLGHLGGTAEVARSHRERSSPINSAIFRFQVSISRRLGFYAFSLPLAISALSLLSPGRADAVTTWSWTFTASGSGTNVSGAGTITTADVTPAPLTSYTITGISGTVTYTGAISQTATITSLVNPNDQFQWDGSTGFFATQAGIFFDTDYLTDNNLYHNGLGFNALTNFDDLNGYIVLSSSIQPGSATPVPGPLPVMGAAAAFGFSRRLRGRIRNSTTISG